MILNFCHFLSAHGFAGAVAAFRQFLHRTAVCERKFYSATSQVGSYAGWIEHPLAGVIAFFTHSGELQYKW